MSEKYDGWTVKVSKWGKPYLVAYFCRNTRSEVIKAFEDNWGEEWKKVRSLGWYKIVKIRLVEVKQ